MATDHNFRVKNGLEVGGQEVITSSGVITSAALGGQTLSSTDSPTFDNLTLTGSLRGPATMTIDPAAVGDNTGTLVIAGNLQVDGTTTTINSTSLSVDDLNITLASGAANAAAADGAGITVDGASATLTYNSTQDEWETNKPFTASSASTDIPQLRAEYDSGNYLDIKHNLINAVSSGGNDSILLQTAGSTVVKLDQNNNALFNGALSVNIPGTTPAAQLHVYSVPAEGFRLEGNDEYVYQSYYGTVSSTNTRLGYIGFANQTGTATDFNFVNDQSGNFTFDTLSATRLEISSSMINANTDVTITTSNEPHLRLDKSTANGQTAVLFREQGTTRTQLTSNFSDDKFYLFHGGINSLVIDSSGQAAFNAANTYFNNASARIHLNNGTGALLLGSWDGTNHRIEGGSDRPILMTSYNSGGIKFGANGSADVTIANNNIYVNNGDIYLETEGNKIEFNTSSTNAHARILTGDTFGSNRLLIQGENGVHIQIDGNANGTGDFSVYNDNNTNHELFLEGSTGTLGLNKSSGFTSGGFAVGLGPRLVMKQKVNSQWGGINIESEGNDAVLALGNSNDAHYIATSYRASAGYKPLKVIVAGDERINITTGGIVCIGPSHDTPANSTDALSVHGGDIEVRDTVDGNQGGRIYAMDHNHAIYFREGATNRTNYYQYGGARASNLGHRFFTGGALANQVVRLQIADDEVFVDNTKLVVQRNSDNLILQTNSDPSNYYAKISSNYNYAQAFDIKARGAGSERTIMTWADGAGMLLDGGYGYSGSGTPIKLQGRNILIDDDGVTLPEGDNQYLKETHVFEQASNPPSYSTSTNQTYTGPTSQKFPINGEVLIGRVAARAYTRYLNIRTNVNADNQMFYFRTMGYFYSYGIEECYAGGYTYGSPANSVISKDYLRALGNSHNIVDLYRDSNGFLCMKIDINHQGYTEGKMYIYYGHHEMANSSVKGVQITDVIQRDDGVNAF